MERLPYYEPHLRYEQRLRFCMKSIVGVHSCLGKAKAAIRNFDLRALPRNAQDTIMRFGASEVRWQYEDELRKTIDEDEEDEDEEDEDDEEDDEMYCSFGMACPFTPSSARTHPRLHQQCSVTAVPTAFCRCDIFRNGFPLSTMACGIGCIPEKGFVRARRRRC